ncbi:MAG TPA: hypothetical protein VLB73_04150 [Patescibacteria group bacterium]|nr:hypothetical protein [Patescibacteria group bacterium]
MRIEKIILAIAGVFAGLFVAGIAFYIYQTTQTISPSNIKTITLQKPTPDVNAVPLSVDSPADESVTSSKIVTVSGKTQPQATIVVTTDTTDTVVKPSSSGAFSLTVTLATGENRIFLLAVMPDGSESQKVLTVNVTTEDF